MSDTSRKRSRKAKLVPRQVAVSEDELDIELQIPPSKQSKMKRQNIKKALNTPKPTTPQPEPEVYDTSVLKKINASAKEDAEPKTKSPRKFEINIEIEACDDDEEILEINKEDHHTPVCDKTVKIPEKICPTPIILSREIVLDAVAAIFKNSKSIADRILSINIRNTIGNEQPQILDLGWLENLIQDSLEEWRTWQFRSFHREDPLFYKCYICTRSYWFLSEFRDHMYAEHADDETVVIGLEKYEMHEANIIAYRNKIIVIKDIYTPGSCYRCGKDYKAHELELRQHSKYYSSEGCSKNFFSCMGVRDHFPWCKICKVKEKPVKCEICKSRFDTEEDLNSHLVLSHSVRSDVPIMVRYKVCKRCSQRYCCGYLHRCGDRSLLECPHCFMSFSSKKSLDIHTEKSVSPYKCEVCKVTIKFSCLKYKHMLCHTHKFLTVKKCIKCELFNVFLNNDNALAHRSLTHENKDKMQQPNIFTNILIPSSCLYKSSVGPETVPEQVDLASNSEESVTGTEAESIPDSEQKSLEQEESDTEFTMENITVKEEPEETEDSQYPEESQDSQDSVRLVVKEESFEEFEKELLGGGNESENFEHRINIKEEIIEEEHEGDIIKLNFDIEDLIMKRESTDDDDEEYILLTSEESQELDSGENSQQSLTQQKQTEESNSKPEDEEDKRRKRLYRCTMCGYTANHRLYKEHMELGCGKTKHNAYSCTKCDKKFSSLKKYLMHFEEHGHKRLSCPGCQKDFQAYSILAQHVHRHVKQGFIRVKLITETGMSKPDFQCRICSLTVETKDFFKHWELHLNDVPADPVKISRPMDAQDKINEMKIKESIACLSKQPKKCNHCNHEFKRINECKRHIIEHLLSDAYKHKLHYKELRCQVCESGFHTPEKYKQHMRDHASLPVYRCELCDRTFSDSSNFTKHKKVHNLKVLVCDLCGKKFQCKSSLEKHMEKHNSTQPITCKICNKNFYFNTCYKRHVKYFHEKTAKGFRCIICSDRFDNLKSKWEHMWEIHRERKQKADCPICHDSFRKYADVRAHARKRHDTEISVISLKEAKNVSVNTRRYLKVPQVVRPETIETLVVYDSE